MKINHHIFFNSVGSTCKNTRGKELSLKHIVSDCCDAIFNMVEEDFSCAIIIYCYFYMYKSVKSNYAKCLKNKALKNGMLSYIKNSKESRAQKTSRKF